MIDTKRTYLEGPGTQLSIPAGRIEHVSDLDPIRCHGLVASMHVHAISNDALSVQSPRLSRLRLIPLGAMSGYAREHEPHLRQ